MARNKKYTHEVLITDPNRKLVDAVWSEHSRRELAEKEATRMRKKVAGSDAAHFQGVTFKVQQINHD